MNYSYSAVPFRNRERITFDHLVSMKKPNETAALKVLRDGEEHEFNIALRPVSYCISFSSTSNFRLVSLVPDECHRYMLDLLHISIILRVYPLMTLTHIVPCLSMLQLEFLAFNFLITW